MVRKILAMLLTCAISASLLAGCGSGEKSADSTEEAADMQEGTGRGEEDSDTAGDAAQGAADGDLVPLTFAKANDAADLLSKLEGVTFEDNLWNDLIAERLGYDVQYLWIAPDSEIHTQKFNAAVASGTIPDIVCVGKEDLKRLVEGGLVVDIAPYFEEYASDLVKEMIGAAGEACITACTYDGIQYGIPYVDCDLETAHMVWIRQDWLDELNLEGPKTMDDLMNVMAAFMDYAGDGAVGMAVSQPQMWSNAFSFKGFCNGYGAFPWYWVEDESGNLEYGSTTPEMKEALGVLADMYQNGYLDPEFYVKDDQKVQEDMVNGKCGIMYGYHAMPLWPLQAVIDSNPDADWRPYALPMKEAGKITPGIEMFTNKWYAVSRDCANPQALIELLNLYCEKVFDPELNEYTVYANPGGEIESLWHLSPVVINSPNKNQLSAAAIEEPLKTGEPGDLFGEQKTMWEYSYKALQGDKAMWSWNRVFGEGGSQQLLISYQNDSNVELVYNEFVGVPGEVMSSKMSSLDSMLQQEFVKIISCQDPLDAFDKVVEEWKAAGGDEVTQEVNEWYASSK